MSEFPIDVHLEDIFAAVNTLDTVILKAEPGVGKTTRLPLYLLKNTNKKILVVEPRRVAAKLPATYLAECIGESVGDTIGYKVRFDNKVTPDSRLVFMTDGMFVKHLNDPEFLDGFEYVIFDEFHERTLNNDLGLALVENHREKMRSNEMRPLKLVIMSATLDTDLMKDLYPSAKVFELKGEMFGVDVSYLPREEKEFCENHVVRAVKSLESNQRIKGNVLVFLTGKAEISKTCHQLAQSFGAKYEVIPFMSETAAKSLKKINYASSVPKIICSTNVAETSVTLPGVKYVIDGGEHFQQVFAPWNGLPFIKKLKICQDSAIQRAGRAGRLEKGYCIRLYSEADFISRNRFNMPEVERSDLSSFIMDGLRGAGISNIDHFHEKLSFATPPPEDSFSSARECLSLVGFLNEHGELTKEADSSVSLPVHPRLAAIINFATEQEISNFGKALASVIESGGFLNQKSSGKFYHESDFLLQCEILLKKATGSNLEHPKSLFNEQKLVNTLELYKKLKPRKVQKVSNDDLNLEILNRLLLKGFPDRVARILPKFKQKQEQAKKKGEVFLGGQYMFTLGKSANLSQESNVQGHDLLISPVATEKYVKSKKQIFLDMTSSISEDSLKKYSPHLISRKSSILVSEKKGISKFSKMEQTYYGQILLSESQVELGDDELSEALKQIVVDSFPKGFIDEEYYWQYCNKLVAINNQGVENSLPAFDGEFLELFVDVILEGKKSTSEVYETKLEKYFEDVISYEDLSLLESVCPSKLRLENSNTVDIFWNHDGVASIKSKIQNFYGIKKKITIGTSKIEPKIILLAPNDRPMQVTSDLCGFFSDGYFELAKEYKRRYPKHYWPDNPEAAGSFLLNRHVK